MLIVDVFVVLEDTRFWLNLKRALRQEGD